MWGSNPRPRAHKTRALPSELNERYINKHYHTHNTYVYLSTWLLWGLNPRVRIHSILSRAP
jgi:hypothetical protein